MSRVFLNNDLIGVPHAAESAGEERQGMPGAPSACARPRRPSRGFPGSRRRRCPWHAARIGGDMKKLVRRLALSLALVVLALPASPASRIKDIADFEGIRDNLLVGYGLVVGLNGTGDTLNRSIFTRESLIGML